MFAELRLFRIVATGVLVVFMTIMVVVTVVAFSRPSGSTRQDMSKAQLLRKASLPQAEHVAEVAP